MDTYNDRPEFGTMISAHNRRIALGLAAAMSAYCNCSPSMADPIAGTALEVRGDFHSGKNDNKDCSGLECELQTDKDISAAVCMPDRRCYAASDEARFIQEFAYIGNAIWPGRRLYLAEADEIEERNRNIDELDIEAFAADGEEIFAVGSHSWKRNGCEAHPSRHAIFHFKPRIDLQDSRKPVQSTSVSLDSMFEQFPLLRDSFGQPLQKNGINIEGAAIMGGRMYIGFRAPYGGPDDQHGYVLSLESAALANGTIAAPKLHTLQLGQKGAGIRSMETVAGGLLLLTGPAGANAGDQPPCDTSSPHLDNAAHLYFWNLISPNLKHIAEIELPKKKWKAETVMLDPARAQDGPNINVVIFFDGPKNGKPRRYAIPRELF